MHFVIGGAYNGKREWVKNKLITDAISADSIQFRKSVVERASCKDVQVIIWTGIEKWIEEKCVQGLSEATILEQWKRELTDLAHWEKGSNQRQVIIIGTDQSKGIVPLDRMKRFVRDVSGWCHQFTAKKASRVTRVWYGIAEELKNEED
ncbi:bifunctional adenosylcobinamide kinase/adenosylcobinamide-phosphate guanylyltransferase [Jeotgalibacillus marinus]|uniref:Bifunctional adenosylcobinamide kinase/adenosylcobinamide-phosphate guanylyltransferase n=1 Tax=Jeotgalibacillus marinus TaxID=86667 RepID=A0ABV3Q218_9BACL